MKEETAEQLMEEVAFLETLRDLRKKIEKLDAALECRADNEKYSWLEDIYRNELDGNRQAIAIWRKPATLIQNAQRGYGNELRFAIWMLFSSAV
ncbi:MAG: hypothetical protein LBD80_07960 [Tannerella sp.]|jgi:hypothetical protein|nr:hypothetical protein [Tannerella sp.]